jgi:SAM-dependent methyltransferase
MKNQTPIHHYADEFNTNSAEIIVPFIKKTFNPSSVIDIGCGIGTWLKVFDKNGVNDILGIDGQHVLNTNQLLIPKEKFAAKDLNNIDFNDFKKTFDIAVCLEVVEHLEEIYADNIVKALCSFSEIIIFSAAIPGQTGENHYNEQYPTYWTKKFNSHGYVFVDLIRPRFWNNSKIEWWYRQNIFVVIKKTTAITYNFSIWNENIYIIKDMVEMYTQALNSKNSTEIISTKVLLKLLIKRLINMFK